MDVLMSNATLHYVTRPKRDRGHNKVEKFNSYFPRRPLCSIQLLYFCTAWRKGVRIEFGTYPSTSHRYLHPLLGRCLPVLDEICKRSMNFVCACLSHTSSLVKYVAHHIIFGLNFSRIGRNVLYCSGRYADGFDVSDVLTNNSRFISDTIHSRARSEVTEVQLHEVNLLFKCVLIREGQAALPCWFPKSDVL